MFSYLHTKVSSNPSRHLSVKELRNIDHKLLHKCDILIFSIYDFWRPSTVMPSSSSFWWQSPHLVAASSPRPRPRRSAELAPPAVTDPATWAWILLISLTNPLLRSQSRRHKRFCSQISVAEKLTTQAPGAMNTWELLFLTRIVGVGPAKPRSDTDLFIYMHHQHGKRDCTKYRLITLNNSTNNSRKRSQTLQKWQLFSVRGTTRYQGCGEV